MRVSSFLSSFLSSFMIWAAGKDSHLDISRLNYNLCEPSKGCKCKDAHCAGLSLSSIVRLDHSIRIFIKTLKVQRIIFVINVSSDSLRQITRCYPTSALRERQHVLPKIQSCCPVLTADLQFTLHHVLPTAVHRFARVHSPIKGTRFTDLQSQNAVVTEHPVLGFTGDVHLVFVPGHFGLAGRYLRSMLAPDCV